MIVKGYKFTHDGAIATFDGNRLVNCHEAEKGGNARYAHLDKSQYPDISKRNDFDIAIDGWHDASFLQRIGISKHASYSRFHRGENYVAGENYTSYCHTDNHVFSAYMTRPEHFPNECLCPVIDGGADLQIYHLAVENDKVVIKHIYRATDGNRFKGLLYSVMGNWFGPYSGFGSIIDNNSDPDAMPMLSLDYSHKGQYDWPGKLMAYMGTADEVQAMKIADDICEFNFSQPDELTTLDRIPTNEHRFCEMVYRQYSPDNSDATILLAIHYMMQSIITDEIRKIADATKINHICCSGGTFLNIKLNSHLRKVGFNIHVPPFPNDSGSAFGVACNHLASKYGYNRVNWNAFAGDDLIIDAVPLYVLSNYMLGLKIANENCIGVLLDDRCELGPRALGSRSIIADPRFIHNKTRLNSMKKREDWRPVAPMATRKTAERIFEHTGDKYMLFDNRLLPEYRGLFGAITHTDGTSRLQVVDDDNPNLRNVLQGFENKTGYAMLCNTSANNNGFGFFNRVSDAIKFATENNVDFVWASGSIYYERKR